MSSVAISAYKTAFSETRFCFLLPSARFQDPEMKGPA